MNGSTPNGSVITPPGTTAPSGAPNSANPSAPR
jgi:hypothetical protein